MRTMDSELVLSHPQGSAKGLTWVGIGFRVQDGGRSGLSIRVQLQKA